MKNSAEKLPDDERDDVIFTCQQSIAAIEAWKQHQLRSIQQDKARTDILAKLDENSENENAAKIQRNPDGLVREEGNIVAH